MDRKTLSQYRGLKAEVEAIKDQLESLKLTYGLSSITYDGIGTGNSTRSTSSPTEAVIIKIETLERRYEETAERSLKLLTEIEEWIDEVDDPEIKALCRYRYILGLTWEQTARKVYGYVVPDAARMRIKRYFENN